MNEKLEKSPPTWSDADDVPELTESFFDKGDWAINGKPVSKKQGQIEASKIIRTEKPTSWEGFSEGFNGGFSEDFSVNGALPNEPNGRKKILKEREQQKKPSLNT